MKKFRYFGVIVQHDGEIDGDVACKKLDGLIGERLNELFAIERYLISSKGSIIELL